MSDSAVPHAEPRKRAGTWRIVLAAILDFFLVLFAGGFAIAWLTGNLTESGFQLSGGPALAVFALIALYFILFGRFLGGTLCQRLLRVR
jgi:hypothetical protein